MAARIRERLEEIARDLAKRHDEANARFTEIQNLGTLERESQFANLIGCLQGSLTNAQIEIESLVKVYGRRAA